MFWTGFRLQNSKSTTSEANSFETLPSLLFNKFSEGRLATFSGIMVNPLPKLLGMGEAPGFLLGAIWTYFQGRTGGVRFRLCGYASQCEYWENTDQGYELIELVFSSCLLESLRIQTGFHASKIAHQSCFYKQMKNKRPIDRAPVN